MHLNLEKRVQVCIFKSLAAHSWGLQFNLHHVFEGESHISLAVDHHELHHSIPGCLIKIIHLLRQTL